MTEPSLTDRLRATALCETDRPADAATALLVAATTILSARWDDESVAYLLSLGIGDALAMRAKQGTA